MLVSISHYNLTRFLALADPPDWTVKKKMKSIFKNLSYLPDYRPGQNAAHSLCYNRAKT